MAERRKSKRADTAASGSWLALLASTTVGDAANTVHTEVRANGVSEGAYRLVVQSYAGRVKHVPGRSERPVGSAQRAVTADELRNGVHVNLPEPTTCQGHRGKQCASRRRLD